MNPDAAIQNERLLGFSQQVLDQALGLVAAHLLAGAPRYAGPVGSHLRHVIEHYEALTVALTTRIVDYDGRARDKALETNAGVAQQRLHALSGRLRGWTAQTLNVPVQVLGQGGLTGEFHHCTDSSIGRELAFLASHAVHHFALLAAHCQQHGITTPAHFGKAPSTVANELAIERELGRPKPPVTTRNHHVTFN